MGRKRQHSPWWSKEAAPLTDVNQRAEERDFPAAQDTAQSPSPQPQNKKVVLPQNCLPWVRLSTALSTVIICRHTHQRSLSLLPPTHSPCCHHSPPHAPGSRRRVRILCWCHLQRQGKTVSIRQGRGECCKKLSACHIHHCSLSLPPLPPLPLSISHPARMAQGGGHWSLCEHSTRGGSAAAKLICLSHLPLLAHPVISPPPLSSVSCPLASLLSPLACARIKEEGVKPLLVPFTTPWHNCQYSARGGGAAKNCLPVISAIAHSPYHHLPPVCQSHILRDRFREEDIGASTSAVCKGLAKL